MDDSLRDLEKIIARNPGVLDDRAFAEAKRAMQDLVPRGHYVGPAYGVVVVGVGCDPKRPTAKNFYVEFHVLRDDRTERLPVAIFLETYRALATDLV